MLKHAQSHMPSASLQNNIAAVVDHMAPRVEDPPLAAGLVNLIERSEVHIIMLKHNVWLGCRPHRTLSCTMTVDHTIFMPY